LGRTLEHAIAKIEKDYRVHVPKGLLSIVGWLPQHTNEASLLVGHSGRCRILSGTEVLTDPACQRLRDEIASSIEEPLDSVISFREDSITALPLRLLPLDLVPYHGGFRITLPRLVISIFQASPGQDSVALLVSQGHVELWSLQTLRVALNSQLDQLGA